MMARIAALTLAAALALLGLSSLSPHAHAQEEDEPASCVSCHAPGATREGAPVGMRIDASMFSGSVHSKSCVQCHEDMEDIPHTKKKADPVNCSNCHEAAAEKYALTPHGKLAKDGMKPAPDCASCHPPHATLPAADPRSSLHKSNLPATCGACHSDMRPDGTVRQARTVTQYALSVHGLEVLEKGNLKAAGCTDCHPVHDMRYGNDPASRTSKTNVPKLCGTCHEAEARAYEGSVHGVALAHGKMDAAACTDCHSEHSIQAKGPPGSGLPKNRIVDTCASCHAAERIVSKYGLPADAVSTYRHSYHGLAEAAGSLAAANCASCHGFHDVLPSSDPKSRIHPSNLLATCSSCHEGASAGFIQGRVHAAPDPEDERAAWWVRFIYSILIPATVGGMLFHNGVILFSHLRAKWRAKRAQKQQARFTAFEVLAHAGLAISFIVLAVTGFALTNPNAGWVNALAAIGMDEGVRSWIHRAAGVLFTATAFAHVVYSFASKKGRATLKGLAPRVQDARDAVRNVTWHLGLTKQKPRFDRFDYTMKVEYWALVWGGFLMLVTGVALWFKVEVTHFVPRWMVYVAERIHFYEAILAVAAILVWHFFFVIFHPAEFPLSLTMFDGKVTEHEMKEMHPVEYERMQAAARGGTPPVAAEPAGGAAPGAAARPPASPPPNAREAG